MRSIMIKRKCAILLMIAAMMALAGCGESDVPRSSHQIGVLSHVNMLCIEGYKFAVFSAIEKGDIVQIWENGPNGPRPMECTKVMK